MRVRFFRNLGNIVMDLDDVERIDLNALAGADNFKVNDVGGYRSDDHRHRPVQPGRQRHDEQRAADTITIDATNGDDVVVASGALPARMSGGRSPGPGEHHRSRPDRGTT